MRQIIEKADRLVGGGILTKAEPSKASPRSDFMVDYPYVWNLAEMHRLGSVTPHHFFAELERRRTAEAAGRRDEVPWRMSLLHLTVRMRRFRSAFAFNVRPVFSAIKAASHGYHVPSIFWKSL
ncbi:hypothetical protein [Mesorhizobium sp.]|uniref:hypothetical protein n=1 Tax=Mesorhizobium sp. TaxID=1871066 RepID=UPI0025C61BEB|nr:hypothetical protein [Mesorhizobium sp.]